MPGAEEVINRITARNTKYSVTIGMSNMFFTLPIAQSLENILHLARKVQNINPKRLPQGYLNSVVTAHTLLTSQIDMTIYESSIISCVDDIIVMHDV